ncbi:MAG: hypothetical protein PUC44_00530 [Eubacteriales bacterium]|nr:hypothetical protein [Eubacteriales bacterium]
MKPYRAWAFEYDQKSQQSGDRDAEKVRRLFVHQGIIGAIREPAEIAAISGKMISRSPVISLSAAIQVIKRTEVTSGSPILLSTAFDNMPGLTSGCSYSFKRELLFFFTFIPFVTDAVGTSPNHAPSVFLYRKRRPFVGRIGWHNLEI